MSPLARRPRTVYREYAEGEYLSGAAGLSTEGAQRARLPRSERAARPPAAPVAAAAALLLLCGACVLALAYHAWYGRRARGGQVSTAPRHPGIAGPRVPAAPHAHPRSTLARRRSRPLAARGRRDLAPARRAARVRRRPQPRGGVVPAASPAPPAPPAWPPARGASTSTPSEFGFER